MAILAGIDEAGLGPILGPLVVSGVAFRVPDDAVGTCLWDTLRATCRRTSERGQRRLQIADSKKLYRGRAGLAPLERAALVMLATAGHRPTSWRALLKLVTPDPDEVLDRYPWYAGTDIALPLADGVGDIGTRANAVRRDCREHGIECVGVFSQPLLAGQFNHLIHSIRNKAVVLLDQVLRMIDRIVRSAADERVRLYIDRLGGRVRYRESLHTAFPDCDLRIVQESENRSAYRLVGAGRMCEIAFVTGGDARHFPVALASIYSKYLRELYMHAFNTFWSGKAAQLKPTAGYYTDARRWLSDAAEHMDRLRVDRDLLIRQR